MNKFQPAGPAEILRSAQKDEEFLHILRRSVSDLIQRCLGVPTWAKWQNFISTFSDVLYYSLTTLSGLQTLGEEYVNIVQVDNSLRSVPSKWKHFVDISLQTFGYYSLLRFQRLVENHINIFTAVAQKFGSKSQEAVVAAYLPFVFKVITILQRLHLILFYFSGSYYTFPKRLSGIRYVVIRRWLSQASYKNPFKLLGYIAASQLCVGLIVAFYSMKLSSSLSNIIDDYNRTTADTSTSMTPGSQCSLCLEKRNHSTVTPCGHLFCWSCITSWMQNKEECPLCREQFSPAKLVFLQNY